MISWAHNYDRRPSKSPTVNPPPEGMLKPIILVACQTQVKIQYFDDEYR